MDLACFCSKSQDKTTTNLQSCDPNQQTPTMATLLRSKSRLKVGHLDRLTAAKLTNQCKLLGFDRIEATCKAKLARYLSHGDQAAKMNVMLDKKPGTDRALERGVPDPIKAQTQRPTGAWLIPSPLATG
jgi:hypothetical protein